MFENRTYRKHHQKKGLVSFDVTVKETNLNIQALTDLSGEAVKAILEIRHIIETYIDHCPEFATSFVPIAEKSPAHWIINEMLSAGKLAGVGPMAAVAGMVAEYTGQKLLKESPEVIVENGGDIYVKSNSETIFSIFAGDSPFSMVTGIRIEKRNTPYGICTSSGTLGHSKSFGKADAVSILADSCPLADAVATSLGNQVSSVADIQGAIETGKAIPGIQGIVIIKGDKIGAWGDLTLVKL